jgi:hypothetical protein
LSPVFVDYITNPDHPWQVNLGIPYATSYWQVGDSSEQNGYFKMLLNLAKRRLVSFKLKHNIPICLTGEDIVPLINAAWDKSFGNVKTNKKAIAVRGWNPLNKNLLLHKEICSGTNSSETLESTNTIDETDTNTERVADTNTERVAETNSETTDFIRNLPELLNSALGVSGDTFGKIVQHVLINGGIERNKENLARGENIQDNLQNAKRLTSGVMVKHGVHEVNNPTVQMLIKDNRDRANFAEKKSLKKKRKEILKKINAIIQLRHTKPRMNDWNMKDCKDFIQYKKMKGYTKISTSLTLLKERCINIQGRKSPDCSPHTSDDDLDDDIDDDVEFFGD